MQILKLRWNKSYRERHIGGYHLYVKSNSKKQKLEWWLPEAKGWRKWRDNGQKVLASSHKINRFWGSDVQHDVTLNKAILYT